MPERLRIDKYLWAIRVFKTRTQAAEACDQGKVRSGGAAVKASRSVSIGDRYEIRTSARPWMIEVTGLVAQRLPHAEAVRHYADLTPEAEKHPPRSQASSFYTGKRQSKTGRPTKKSRRDLDDFMGDG